jgi:cytochrome c oxidase accessory protein FixG
LPFVRVAGKPAVLIDLPRRELTFFGSTLYATDTVLLMLAMLGVFLGMFLVTALCGRAWCGWGCPQTVYMEFVFRPVERWLEGSRGQKAAKQPWRRWLKWGVFAGLSGVVAHVFLAWFVPVAELSQWVTRPPREHPVGFAVVLVTSALVFFDFAWFREQMCVVACPYARLQLALLDRQSWIVAYDSARGEPRGKLHKSAPQQADHCVDCQACVRVCPTGIDIRDGLQLECISCTQCIDACDVVAKKLG